MISDKQITVTIASLQSIFDLPPVISLIQCLLDMGCKVNLVSYDVEKLNHKIINHPNFNYKSKESYKPGGFFARVKKYISKQFFGKRAVDDYMKESDVLWTTTDMSVRFLGNRVFKYKHVMQVMELVPSKYLEVDYGMLRYPIAKYAQKAYKVVVPEINRAYIQKIWWNIDKTPIVLPNKPYLWEDISELEKNIDLKPLEIIRQERRKIILYLGGICADRDIESYAKAVTELGDGYCLYIIGRAMSDEHEAALKKLIEKYPCIVYLGFFKAPYHLCFVKYAYIGLLPYKVATDMRNISSLNALYCAPNKIYEYSKFNVPMVGSNVLGLKLPFEKYNIGVCADDDVQSIVDAIKVVDDSHSIMSENCTNFYEDTDFKKIVIDILS